MLSKLFVTISTASSLLGMLLSTAVGTAGKLHRDTGTRAGFLVLQQVRACESNEASPLMVKLSC